MQRLMIISLNIIEAWGHKALECRRWKGIEIVLDAGCGSGKLTQIISLKFHKGKFLQ